MTSSYTHQDRAHGTTWSLGWRPDSSQFLLWENCPVGPWSSKYNSPTTPQASLVSPKIHVKPLQWRHDGAMASQITSLTIVYSTVYSVADQRKHHSSASLAFVREIHQWPLNFPHRWPVTQKMFPFDDVIMYRDEYITTQKYFGNRAC